MILFFIWLLVTENKRFVTEIVRSACGMIHIVR